MNPYLSHPLEKLLNLYFLPNQPKLTQVLILLGLKGQLINETIVFSDIIRLLQEMFVNNNDEVRQKVSSFLHCLLKKLPSSLLPTSTLLPLFSFLLSRTSDLLSIEPTVLSLQIVFQVLLLPPSSLPPSSSLPPPSYYFLPHPHLPLSTKEALEEFWSFFGNTTKFYLPAFSQKIRGAVLQMLRRAVIVGGGITEAKLKSIIVQIEGEKDPRNILLIFRLLSSLLSLPLPSSHHSSHLPPPFFPSSSLLPSFSSPSIPPPASTLLPSFPPPFFPLPSSSPNPSSSPSLPPPSFLLPSSSLLEDIFEFLECYYPVSFTPPKVISAHLVQIRKEDLEESLDLCLILAGKKRGLEIALAKIESNFVESQIAGAKTIKWMLEEEERGGKRMEGGRGRIEERGRKEGGGGERQRREGGGGRKKNEEGKMEEEGLRDDGEEKMNEEGGREEEGEKREEAGEMEEGGGRRRDEGRGRNEEVFSDGKMQEIWERVRNLIFDEDDEELKISVTGLVSAIVKHLNHSYNQSGVQSFSKYELMMNILGFLLEEVRTDFMSENSGISIKIFTVSLFFSSFSFLLLLLLSSFSSSL